jgi:hypothetical protein
MEVLELYLKEKRKIFSDGDRRVLDEVYRNDANMEKNSTDHIVCDYLLIYVIKHIQSSYLQYGTH